jgi:hypothetical protein
MIAGFPFLAGRPLWSGLAAFYKLDGLTDSSGNGNTLTNDEGVSFVAGKIGNAAQFNGENWLESSSLDLSGLSEFTICFWVQHLDVSDIDELNEVAGDWSAGSGPIIVAFSGLGQFDEYGFSSLGVQINTSLGAFTVFDPTQRNADWRFIAIRLNGNGLQLKTNNENWITTAVSSGATLDATEGAFYVGDGGDEIPLADEDKLDAFGVWNRALSDTNIVNLYNAGTGREI